MISHTHKTHLKAYTLKEFTLPCFSLLICALLISGLLRSFFLSSFLLAAVLPPVLSFFLVVLLPVPRRRLLFSFLTVGLWLFVDIFGIFVDGFLIFGDIIFVFLDRSPSCDTAAPTRSSMP